MRRARRPNLLAAAAAVLLIAMGTGRADSANPEKSLALFFDGMENHDYPKAMKGVLEIVALDERAPADGQTDCFAALEGGDAARAKTACDAFVKQSGDDPRSHVGVALASIIDERPLDAVRSLDAALKLDPRNLAAHLVRRTLAEGGVGQIGDGWAVPSAGGSATLRDGFDRFASGDFKAAAAAFKTLVEAGQVHGKVPLMLYIARKRSGLQTGDELDPMLDLGGARYHMLISALRGEAKPKDAWRTYTQTWAEGDDYASNRFFLGEAALLQGDKAEAKRYFTKAAAVKQEVIEVRLAKAELARLSQP